MSDTATPTAPAMPGLATSLSTGLAARPFLPLLVILFVGSGCAALIYEIVWLQMLGLVIGQSTISLGVLLGTFMGGMCLGSLLLPKFMPRNANPMLVYGVLELMIGAVGLLELVLVPFMGDLYTHMAAPGGGAVALRSVMAGICLLPPTMLMGATLPAIARYVESSSKGVSWLGFFYGGNTVGAVFGCLLAGFYLLRFFNTTTATLWAVAINAVVGGLAIVLAVLSKYQAAPETASKAERIALAPGAWTVYLTLALSGFTGLGAEVVWTRQLGLMLGATVYTFSNILAVFLLGLGIGSSIGSFVARSSKEPKAALAWCQFLLAGSIAWAAYAISMSLPFWPVDPTQSTHPWYTFQVNLAECCWAVLPGALLWGASFPLGLAALVRKGQDPGRLVGGLYSANTVGAILGSLIFSLVMMRFFGSQNAQRVLVALCLISGIVAVLPLFMQVGQRNEEGERRNPIMALVGSLMALGAGGYLMMKIDEPNWGAIAWGRNSASCMPGLYPGVLYKPAELTPEELKALEGAKDFNLSRLDVVGNELSLEFRKEDKRAEAEKYLEQNKKTIISAINKKNAVADEFRVLREANARSLKQIKLIDGKIVYNAPSFLSPEQVTTNKDWIKANEPDLLRALTHRQIATGAGNIMPYNESYTPNRYCVYIGEGMNVSVAVTYDDAGYRYFHGAGKVQASSNPEDMRLQRTLGHISALTNYAQTGKKPEDVLVVACGAGVTAGSFVPYDCNIHIVDIEPMVPRYVTPQFADVNHDVIPFAYSGRPTGYPKTKITIDDGRHFIRTTKEKYDVITSDPIDPWVKGCAALNTIEYYQMCKEHLKPGGIMALWIPFYESSEETSKSIIATFFEVFPNGIIWSNDQNGSGYDAVLFGSVDMKGGDGTLELNIDKIQEYLDRPENAFIKRSLQDVHFGEKGIPGTCETVELLATYAGTAPLMTEWSQEAKDNDWINKDSNLRLQYIAGMWINKQDAVGIFNNILKTYTWPKDPRTGKMIFNGSPQRLSALKEILESTGRHDKGGALNMDH